jgi:hypothetical protein
MGPIIGLSTKSAKPSQMMYLSHMENNATQMSKVYAVIGGWDYEGEDFQSLRLFDCFSTANAYVVRLEEHEGYDYSRLDVREVIMQSLLAA